MAHLFNNISDPAFSSCSSAKPELKISYVKGGLGTSIGIVVTRNPLFEVLSPTTPTNVLALNYLFRLKISIAKLYVAV